jgi:hypothetical protein
MAVTIHEMTKTPWVLGLFSRLKASGLALSQFYGIGPNSSPTETTTKNSLVYDLFDNTRTMSSARGPYVGPGKIPPKRIGQGTAHLMRCYEAIPLLYQKIYGMKPLGGQIGEMDTTGSTYVARQQKYAAQRFMNMVEFTVSRMFRGGFSITINGDDWYLGELGAGTIDVSYNIPATNLTNVPAGGTNGTTPVFSTNWEDPACDIVQELLELNKVSERMTGYVQKHIWINSTTYGYLLNNTQLSSIRGTANRIFDTQTQKQIATTDEAREQGFTVIFGAIPQFQFHVYDAVSHNGSVKLDSDTFSELSLYIPDNKALITPDAAPGDWYGLAVGTEPIRENDVAPVQYVTGLHSWAYPTNDPPGFEWRVLYNFCPLLYNPRAHFYATVASP